MADNCKFCSICDRGHISKESVVYCSECDQAFCDQCKKFHEYSNLLKNHLTIPISDHLNLSESVSTNESYCTEHDESYQLFCQSHNECLCLTCFEEHKECNNMVRLTKMTKDIKTSEMFREVKQGLADVKTNIVKIETHVKDNLSSIQTQKDAILDDISKMREKINDHLDNIEQKLRTDVSDLAEERINDIEITQELLKERKSEVAKYQKQMDDMAMYGSELQTFLNLRNMLAEIIVLEQFLQSMAYGENLDQDVLACNMNKYVNSILDMKRFGSVQREKTHCKILLEFSKNKEAQLIGGGITSIDDLKVTFLKQLENLGDRITGCCVLPDGRIVFCDFGNQDCIVICGTDGIFLDRVCLKPSYAYDVTCIDEHTVAVSSTSRTKTCINIVDINKKEITKYIPLSCPCYGITFNKGHFFCCAEDKGILKINSSTYTSQKIVKCKLKYFDHIESFNGKLYYTENYKHSIICCNIGGEALWVFKDEGILTNPCGISVDDRCNVYVTSQKMVGIFVLSTNGQKGRQLLSKDDGFKDPLPIQYDRTRHQLLVSNEKGPTYVFDVSL